MKISQNKNIPDSSLRTMKTDDLEQVLAWRNHPDIRYYMYTQHEITLEEHSHWFNNNRLDSNCHLLIFETAGEAQGFININQGSHLIADWGFYLSPKAPQGTGSALGHLALCYAFNTLKLHKLCGEALGFNDKSIRFHQKLGFSQEGILRQQYFDGENYQDIYRFGLLACEWRKKL